MKTLFNTVASLSVMLLALSCSLTEIDTQMTAQQAIAAIRLECSAESQYNIPAERAQVISFQVASTTPWSINCPENPDWLTFSPASSAVSSLKEDIRVSISANPGFEDRIATLVVTGENTQKSHTITIKQLRNGRFEFTPVAADIPAAGTAVTFTVTTNLDWTVQADDSWLVIDKASGEGKDGVAQTISLSAAANSSISRDTKVTVKAGEFSGSFKVKQLGAVKLDLVLEGNPEFDPKGESTIIGVDADMDWKVEAQEPIVAEKIDATHLKLVAPWNKYFVPQSYTITIKPESSQYGDLARKVEFTQDINFKFEGDCILMEDGSVRIGSSKKAQIITKEAFRYVTAIITLGDMSHFGDKGQLCFETLDAKIMDPEDPNAGADKFEIMNQLILGTNTRFRTNGGKEGYGYDTYDSKSYSITKADILKLEEYKVNFTPNSGKLHMEFVCDGKTILSWESSSKPSAFEYDARVAGHYFFGYEQSPGDDTWYTVKSFEIIPVAED